MRFIVAVRRLGGKSEACLLGKYLLASALLVAAAGCGYSQAQQQVPTPAPTLVVPTSTPTPPFGVTGGRHALVVNRQPVAMSTFKHYLSALDHKFGDVFSSCFLL